MADIHFESAIVRDISLLYELSLSIGNSIDLEKNCDGFLKLLLRRKNLDFASVWINNKFIGNGLEKGYSLVYAYPSSRVDTRSIINKPSAFSRLDRSDVIIINSDDDFFDEVITEKNINKGSYAIFNLEELGFLKLYSTTHEPILKPRELSQLKNVIKKFAISVEGCLFYDTALKEIANRKQTEEQLRKSEEYQRILSETSPDFIFMLDRNGTIQKVNRVQPGHLKEEVVGQQALAFILPEYHEAFKKAFRKTIETGQLQTVETEVNLPDGRHYFFNRLNPIAFSDTEISIVLISTDITSRKQAEEKLIRLSQAVEQSSAAVVITDKEGNIEYVNPKFEQITGYSYDEVIGRNPRILKSGKTPEKIYKQLWDTLLAGEEWRGEFSNKKKDGTIYYESASISPVKNTEGITTHFLAIKEDITEYKLAQENLRLSEEKYRNIFDSIIDVYVEIDVGTGKILEISPSVFLILGYPRNESIGKPIATYTDPKELNKLLDTLKKQDRVSDYELSLINKDGKVVPCSFSISLRRGVSGKSDKIVGTMRDISERKKAEEKLKESQSQFSAVLQTVVDGIIMFDSSGKIIMVNAAAEKIFNYKPDELNGKSMEIILCSNCKEHISELLDHYNSGKKFIDINKRIETEGIRKDGTSFPMEISISETKVTEQYYFTAAIHDITELKDLIKSLEQSNKSLSEFAYIASHDLREPLRKVSSFGSLLYETLNSKLDADSQENLEFMIDGAKRMQQMIDDLLSYSSITSKADGLSSISLDLVLDDILKFDLAAAIEEVNVKIIVENNLGEIFIEPTHIKQLIQNLISNAIKYRKRKKSSWIKIRSINDKSKVKIEIEDNGIGINKEYQEKIFIMFKRLHSRSEYTGSGIGLAVCKKIVDVYGGEIGVSSKLGKGSTFWFELPKITNRTI